MNDNRFMEQALQVADKCRNVGYYGVGCVIVAADGAIIGTGYTGEESSEHDWQISLKHAEEVAIEKAKRSGVKLNGTTLYSTLEPCSRRKSGLKPCVSHIVENFIARVVYGTREPYDPELGINCKGHEILEQAGIIVTELHSYTARCQESIIAWKRYAIKNEKV